MIKRTKIRNNGITFFYEQNPSAGSVTAALFFKTGILYEKEREYGVTRFVQELLFRSRLASPPLGQTGQRIGRDHAAFFCTVPAGSAPQAVRTLLGVTEREPFSADLIETVRADLLRERAAFVPSREDETERLYFDLPFCAVPPCGTEQTLRALTQARLERWRESCFSRSDACVILTGCCSDDERREIEAFLRELPAQKGRRPDAKPLFPQDQFFRTSADDRYLPTDGDTGRIELLFEIDLGETKPVWAAILRRLLADRGTGALYTALTKAKLTDEVHSELRTYRGFAVLKFSFAVFHKDISAAVTKLSEAIAACKDGLSSEQIAPLLPYYAENRLYRHPDGADRACELGLHNCILYTDDIALPERRTEDAVTEQMIEAADDVLIPDNAMFLIYYNEKCGADLSAIRQSVMKARIRLFI